MTCIKTKSGAQALGLRLAPGHYIDANGLVRDEHDELVTAGHMRYRTWLDDHNGNLVGDWDLPQGTTPESMGRNAAAVIYVTEEGRNELSRQHGALPYESGVVPHFDGQEMTYSFQHDFFAGGFGLEEYIGKTEVDYNVKVGKRSFKIKSSHGDLLMFYQMMCAKAAAEQAGHSIEFTKLADGSYEATVDAENRGMIAQ